jgi:hypothetical protein
MERPDLSLDARRQRADLAFLGSGAEFSFGDACALPLPVPALQALRADSPGVEALHDGGLTAEVLRLNVDGQRWAIKRARAECRVRNADGQTSFLNELHRHAELAAVRAAGHQLPGVHAPVFGSLRAGLVVSPWIDGRHPGLLDARQSASLLAAGCALIERGFFEWDYSAGNLLDDGVQFWLYDFGYCYRFDPLTQLNSAGDGLSVPRYHLAERIEGRHLFGALLDAPDPLAPYRVFKHAALQAYEGLRERLAARHAQTAVLSAYAGWCRQWREGLRGDAVGLYLADAWRAHTSDLDDDLRGRSCTPRTLRRAQWLQATCRDAGPALRASGALSPADAACSDMQLQARYAALEGQARSCLL